ncbi:hypothetical protein RHMOL_Rhmol06G0137300 [Rhododendron molle]|uniref:Uncharacterized protein n=1 Tax=Rhododendron molle TaxID=49168 RepID=A0ACC0NBX1_RHOML|nr:hypothetical protein RHMOL_Rhmol06G0137300 [Rhododendron molle]
MVVIACCSRGVKYLGEHGENVPVAGAVAICSPWDLLEFPATKGQTHDVAVDTPNCSKAVLARPESANVQKIETADNCPFQPWTMLPATCAECNMNSLSPSSQIGDRFISRRLVQKLYDRALCIGLQGYAQLHQPHYSRLADWEGIRKSRSIRDFDNYATCLVGKFETVDTYYRRCSSSSYVGNVSVPLLCVSALDDPLCTAEAIPWDECRWVRAAYEFLSILHCSPFLHIQKKTQSTAPHSSLESSIDQGPYINLTGGMVAAMGNELVTNDVVEIEHLPKVQKSHDIVPEEIILDSKEGEVPIRANPNFRNTVPRSSKQPEGAKGRNSVESTNPIRRCWNQLFQQNRISMWLLGYIAIVSTWPLVGAALHFVFKKKLRSVLPANKA